MIPSPVTRAAGAVFATAVLDPIRVGSALFPTGIWTPLEWLSYRVAWAGARITRPLLERPRHPLDAAMRFVDLVEGLVGIEGDWEILDGRRVVRRVRRCPHARRLARTSEFCTRLGQVLGQGLAEALVDDPSVCFEVVGTLSQGRPCCEYRLSVGS
jgi:hypothetical protein